MFHYFMYRGLPDSAAAASSYIILLLGLAPFSKSGLKG